MADQFELLSQIGRGGMGVVWKARDTATGEVVALKLLHDLYAGPPGPRPNIVSQLSDSREPSRRVGAYAPRSTEVYDR
jgi:serine/threonine-protein kinase